MSRTAIYVRKSSESDDRQCLSLPAQMDWAMEACARLSVTDPLIFQESRSAKLPGRPEFNRLMALVQEGGVDTIVCWKADRLARNALDGGSVLFALESKKLVRIVTADRTYLGEPDEEFILHLELGLSAKYSKDLSKNIRRGLAEKWKRGEWSGTAPVGYRNVRLSADRAVIEVDPNLAPIVQKLFTLAATGNYSLNTLARMARDVWHVVLPPRRSNTTARGLSHSTIDHVLKNPFYYGILRVRDQVFVGSHKPLIERALFDQVQVTMRRRRTIAERPKHRTFAFNGLLACGCGRRLSGYVKVKRAASYVYYVCARHSRKQCAQPPFAEGRVLDAVLPVLDAVTIGSHELHTVEAMLGELRGIAFGDVQSAKERVERESAGLQQQQQKLLDLLLADVITREDYDRKRRELEADRARLLVAAKVATSPDHLYELASSLFSSLVDAGRVFREGAPDDRRGLLRKLGFELRVSDKNVHVEAGTAAKILMDHDGQPIGWRQVEDVWNYVAIRVKLNTLFGWLWETKRRRYGYGPV